MRYVKMFRKVGNFLLNLRTLGNNTDLIINFDAVKSKYHLSSKLGRSFDYDIFEEHEIKDLNKKLKIIKMEHQMLLEKGEIVPKEVSDEDWLKLVNMSTVKERRSYFRFLCKTEFYEISKIKKQAKSQIEREKLLQKRHEEQDNHIFYGLFRNCMFLHISKTRMTLNYNWFLIQAVQFGQIMVIDLDYDHLMNDQELKNAVDQIQFTYGMNKVSKEPWNLYFCNAKVNSVFMRSLKLAIPNLETPNCLISVTEKSYLDIFPKEKLIYLCEGSRKCIQNLDHDAIYIISGFVDKNRQGPASLIKAKKENIPAFQLPLYKYLPGKNRNLTINQEAAILFELKSSGDWKIALKHVPRRKRNQSLEYDQSSFKKNIMLTEEIKSWFHE